MIPELDRSEGRRSNEEDLAAALVHPHSRFILLNGDQALLKRESIEPVSYTRDQLRDRSLSTQDAVLLGFDGEIAWFAVDAQGIAPRERGDADEFTRLSYDGEFLRLASIEEPIDQNVWALLSQARALLAWNRATAHCPVCGGSTVAANGGYHRLCLEPDCGRTHFPRTDPAVIVRVLNGDRCLLARQPQFRPGLRSVIAGFAEPGESLEGTVHREVKEEVGLEVAEVRYLGSQPWPFPMSMMIAFEAHATSDEIHVDQTELEVAEWYTREAARKEMATGDLRLPSRKSIARHMIDGWLAGERSI